MQVEEQVAEPAADVLPERGLTLGLVAEEFLRQNQRLFERSRTTY